MTNLITPDIANAYKWHTMWVAAFWGLMGTGLYIAMIFVTIDNAWWLAPLLLLVGVSVAVARATNQPGC
jgi:Sec-independent protein secretion pathway component TatC